GREMPDRKRNQVEREEPIAGPDSRFGWRARQLAQPESRKHGGCGERGRAEKQDTPVWDPERQQASGPVSSYAGRKHAGEEQRKCRRGRALPDGARDQRSENHGPDGKRAAADKCQRGKRESGSDDRAQAFGGGSRRDRREQRGAESQPLR